MHLHEQNVSHQNYIHNDSQLPHHGLPPCRGGGLCTDDPDDF